MTAEKDSDDALIQDYFSAVDEVKAHPELPPEEKLKRLLTPLITLQASYGPKMKSRRQVLLDDQHVDLKNEIDLENLPYDEEKYDIGPLINTDDSWLLQAGHRAIWVSDKYRLYLAFCRDVKAISEAEFEKIYDRVQVDESEPQSRGNPRLDALMAVDTERMTLDELYHAWLPSLTAERITCRDLLEQVLVCYTIKRAGNGDKGAANALYKLYEKQAGGYVTIRQIIKLLSYQLYREREDSLCSQFKASMPEDIARQKAKETVKDSEVIPVLIAEDPTREEIPRKYIAETARAYLWFIVTGFNLEVILESLIKETQEFSLPSKMKESFVAYLTDIVPERLTETASALERQVQLLGFLQQVLQAAKKRSADGSEPAQISQILNSVASIFRECRHVILDLSLTIDVHLDPFTPVIEGHWLDREGKAREFNSMCYRPQKMGPQRNLTTWLFGPKGQPQYGRLIQLTRDDLLPEVREKLKASVSVFSLDSDEGVGKHAYEDWRSSCLVKDTEETAQSIVEELRQAGFSERDIGILWEASESGQKEAASAYGISDRHVRNILRKAQTILRKK